MRANGIAYDTGFVYKGSVSRERFDPGVVRRELAIIRDDLHCNAVQVVGGDPGRLELAARHAAGLGLEVWFSPSPLELAPDEILSLLIDCAERAERLREAGAEVVFVAGVELTIMNREFMPGNTQQERLDRLLTDPGRRERLTQVSARFNEFLVRAVAEIRGRFGGRITYASIPFERPDWTLFDIVSVELIRNADVAHHYRDGVRSLVAAGKPVAVTGFGASAYAGAGDRGARAMEIVEYDEASQTPLRLDGEYIRDEAGQAANIREVLEIFNTEGVDSAFIWLFELGNFPHRPDGDPRDDLDLASPAIVKTLEGRHGDTYPDMTWEPKAAFSAVADCYRASGQPQRPTYEAKRGGT